MSIAFIPRPRWMKLQEALLIQCPVCGSCIPLERGDYAVTADGLVTPDLRCGRCDFYCSALLGMWGESLLYREDKSA